MRIILGDYHILVKYHLTVTFTFFTEGNAIAFNVRVEMRKLIQYFYLVHIRLTLKVITHITIGWLMSTGIIDLSRVIDAILFLKQK